jgi:o-succinylbenzoate synthase
MRLHAQYQKYTLKFKFQAGTSRGVLIEKVSYFIKLWDLDNPQIYGVGECSLLKGLSIDDREDYELYLERVCKLLTQSAISGEKELLDHIIGDEFPSLQFGFEMAYKDLLNGGNRIIFQSPFTDKSKGISINGLIWMGEEDFMRKQIDAKLAQGYTCLKMKIGALDFAKECELLKYIRTNYSQEQITLRVDANGAFSPREALEKLHILSHYGIHSIEQPIKRGQRNSMRELCRQTPLPIALDEELIGTMAYHEKKALLEEILPQYIILKPSLLGGFKHSQEWIEICGQLNIDWWITSALESNIGLNAISQFTVTMNNPLPQGLGTGQLYTNNINSPLEIQEGKLYYKKTEPWDLSMIGW